MEHRNMDNRSEPYDEEDTWPYEMYRASSSAIRFQVRLVTGLGIACFTLTARDKSLADVYRFVLAPTRCEFWVLRKPPAEQVHLVFVLPEPIQAIYQGYWVTWFSDIVQMGVDGQTEPFFRYMDDNRQNISIGYVKFHAMERSPVDWIFEPSPVILEPICDQKLEDGKLHWQRITNDRLPADAFIGGFEDESLYIARSWHNRSLCPGKYVPSKRLAYVPWGSNEHQKQDFEILCGYNAKWVKTVNNYIPENAFIAGASEVRNGPLYIGRAMLDDNLIVGKVHVLYHACYLPYKGKEVEVHSYEILVSCDETPRGILLTEEELRLEYNHELIL